MSEEGDTEGKKAFDWTFVKGFTAGIVISHINKTLMLGALIGIASGVFIEQNYHNVPHVKTEIRKTLSLLRDVTKRSGESSKK